MRGMTKSSEYFIMFDKIIVVTKGEHICIQLLSFTGIFDVYNSKALDEPAMILESRRFEIEFLLLLLL